MFKTTLVAAATVLAVGVGATAAAVTPAAAHSGFTIYLGGPSYGYYQPNYDRQYSYYPGYYHRHSHHPRYYQQYSYYPHYNYGYGNGNGRY
jgi:hypothetical protein